MQIELYTRPGCHLCVSARALVERECQRRGRAWREINVDEDPELRAAYGELVPVLVVDGAKIAQWRIEAPALVAALDGRDTAQRARRGWFRR